MILSFKINLLERERKNMKTDKKRMDTTNGSGTQILYLDCETWSSDWEGAIIRARPHFSRMEAPIIHCVLPIPDRRETLTFYNTNQCYHSRNRTLTTLKRKEDIAVFQDYDITCRVLKRLGHFSKRLNPMISDNFVLFPLHSPKHSIWINPLSIVDITEKENRTFIEMASGPGLTVKLKKQTIVKYSVNALLAYATSIRDLSGNTEHQGKQPLDIIAMPNTPFGFQLSKKRKLHTFKIPAGNYSTAFFSASIQDYFLNLMKYADLENLTLDKLSELLNNY